MQLCCTRTRSQLCCSSVAALLQLCCSSVAVCCSSVAALLHAYSVCPDTTIYVLQQSCKRAELQQGCNRAATELRAINQPQGPSCDRAATGLQQSCNRAESDQPATRAVAIAEYIRLCFIMLLQLRCSSVAALLKQSTSDSALLCFTLVPTPAVALLSCFTALLSCFTLVLYCFTLLLYSRALLLYSLALLSCFTLVPTPYYYIRAATELQQSCNIAATELYSGALHTRAYTSSSAPSNPLNSALIQP